MQNLIDVFLSVIHKIESEKIPYMVVGSIASMVYGEPRMTHDLDLVVDILPKDAAKFETLFPLEEFYCPPLEVLSSEIIHRGQFNLMHHDSGLKIDIMIRKTSNHSIEEFNRKRQVPFWKGVYVCLASPEDIILKKLVFYREGGSEKHLKDIRGIMAETRLDETYIQEWIRELRLQTEYDKI